MTGSEAWILVLLVLLIRRPCSDSAFLKSKIIYHALPVSSIPIYLYGLHENGYVI